MHTFCRSPALLHQISLVEENSKVDYILVQPAPLPDYGVRFQDGMASAQFRTMRTRAFETGDPSLVRAMYMQLRETAMKQRGYQLGWLEKQLKVEFGVDVTETIGAGLWIIFGRPFPQGIYSVLSVGVHKHGAGPDESYYTTM